MRIKLTEPGYEGFTGVYGAIAFTDGVSDYGVTPQQAKGIFLCLQGEFIASPDVTDMEAQLKAAQDAQAKAEADLAKLQKDFDAYKAAHPAA